MCCNFPKKSAIKKNRMDIRDLQNPFRDNNVPGDAVTQQR